MDTREKIIDAAQAVRIAQDGALVVKGTFDPLVAPLAARLASLKQNSRKMLVLIHTPSDAILPAPARAQLLAALTIVDYVCHEPVSLEPDIDVTHEHARQLSDLIRHVHERQQAE